MRAQSVERELRAAPVEEHPVPGHLAHQLPEWAARGACSRLQTLPLIAHISLGAATTRTSTTIIPAETPSAAGQAGALANGATDLTRTAGATGAPTAIIPTPLAPTAGDAHALPLHTGERIGARAAGATTAIGAAAPVQTARLASALARIRIATIGIRADTTRPTAAVGAAGPPTAGRHTTAATIFTGSPSGADTARPPTAVRSTDSPSAVSGAHALSLATGPTLRTLTTRSTAAIVTADPGGALSPTRRHAATITAPFAHSASTTRAAAAVIPTGAFFAVRHTFAAPLLTDLTFTAGTADAAAAVLSTGPIFASRTTGLFASSIWSAERRVLAKTALAGAADTSATVVTTGATIAPGLTGTPAILAPMGLGTLAALPTTAIGPAGGLIAIRTAHADPAKTIVPVGTVTAEASTAVRTTLPVLAGRLTETGPFGAHPAALAGPARIPATVVPTGPSHAVRFAGSRRPQGHTRHQETHHHADPREHTRCSLPSHGPKLPQGANGGHGASPQGRNM